VRNIVSGILSLIQHNETLETNFEKFRPTKCPHCGKSGLWYHGRYNRKADHENSGSASLNPVTIPRFYCPHCQHTCSVLPECIPPRRHYLWLDQEAVLCLLTTGSSYQSASQQTKPSRWTVSRWWSRLSSQFSLCADHIRLLRPSLGRVTTLSDFWRRLLQSSALSSVMLSLNNAGVIVP